MSRSVYLDTNVLIALFEGNGQIHNALWDFINIAVNVEGASFHTSALSFAELLIKPYRERDQVLARRYLTLAKSEDWVIVHEVEPAVIEMAAALRARMKMRLPDAIHLATASKQTCNYFLTFDFGIPSLPPIEHPISGKPVGVPAQVVHPTPASLSELTKAIQ